jgi:hypothetical protein
VTSPPTDGERYLAQTNLDAAEEELDAAVQAAEDFATRQTALQDRYREHMTGPAPPSNYDALVKIEARRFDAVTMLNRARQAMEAIETRERASKGVA